MKLKAEQLDSHLDKGLSPVYMLTGDEPLLMQECADQIRSQARKRGFGDREVFHVETGFNWEQVLASANSLSLFAEQKLLDVRLSGKPNDQGSKALLEYASRPPQDTVLLLTLPKLDSSAMKAKWVNAIEQSGVLIQIWPMDAQGLPRWLAQRAKQKGLRLTTAAVEVLAQRVEGNLLAAMQELDMLALVSDGAEIDDEQILDLVGNHARHDVYDLCRVAFSGDWPATLRILSHLRQDSAEPTLMLWALTRELRDLLQLLRLQRDGMNFDNACRQARIFPQQRQTPLRKAAQRCRPALLVALLRQAQQLDVFSKTGQTALFWTELELWLSHLTGHPLPLPFYRQ
ncbi:hypothetical protein WH50_15705 [Pokkaliibacter plantistimulans]|uniref:DNA polymerase III subunit delta n=1 Tax=Pokkaliibacter plantistimulans TaxID=1635171 RepID=A0ABX5LY42_9GAMM|nr:DNA polymerase III subunit delta [Pokkaliibacter plantistimulans]PXF30378.1 hypothetical protein WH50_15705 [Pokkaliibacter plantistimulans]